MSDEMAGLNGFGAQLKELRRARKMPRSALAEMVGVSAAAIKNYESSRHNPRLSTLRKLESALQVPDGTLLKQAPPLKSPGRPRKYAPGRINATVRFTPKIYAALKAAAYDEGRSVSEEVEYWIIQCFPNASSKKAPPVLRSMAWVTERLGCSRTTVYSLIAAGKFEVLRHDRWIRFTERSVEQFIEDQIKQQP